MGKLTWCDPSVAVNQVLQNVNTPSGKSALFNSNGGKLKSVTKQMAREIAEDLRSMIIAHANTEFTATQASILQHIESISVSDPAESGDGSYYIELSLSGDLTRPSLGTGEGAYDIVGLFIKGWSPKKKLRRPLVGEWHGMKVAARTYKGGMGFASEAVAEFNSKYSGTAVATLSGAYS